MKKCSYADKYKAIYPPRCNGGDPCDACVAKWEASVYYSASVEYAESKVGRGFLNMNADDFLKNLHEEIKGMSPGDTITIKCAPNEMTEGGTGGSS